MGLFHILGTIVIGFIAGLIARALMPGDDQMGFLATTAVGIAGSFVGGFLASILFHTRAGTGFQVSGLIGSVVGALVILGLFKLLRSKTG